MSEDHTELRTTLTRLHEQVADHDLDPESQELLREALREIEAALGRESADESSLADRLSELAQRFEGSHPKLAEAVGRVVDTLANLGI